MFFFHPTYASFMLCKFSSGLPASLLSFPPWSWHWKSAAGAVGTFYHQGPAKPPLTPCCFLKCFSYFFLCCFFPVGTFYHLCCVFPRKPSPHNFKPYHTLSQLKVTIYNYLLFQPQDIPNHGLVNFGSFTNRESTLRFPQKIPHHGMVRAPCPTGHPLR